MSQILSGMNEDLMFGFDLPRTVCPGPSRLTPAVLYSRVFIKLRREGFMGVNLSSVGCYHKLVSFCANKKEFKPLIYCIPACRFTRLWHGRQALTQTLLCLAKGVAPGAGSERSR